jgi:hypothetical protein
MQAEPFPFLRLPRDIRLMVYERLQPSNKHVRLSNHPDNDPDCAILIVRSLDTAILASCRLINEEARGIWVKTAKQMISSCSAQILLPAQDSAENMVALFLAAVKDQLTAFHYEVGPRGSQDKLFYGIMTCVRHTDVRTAWRDAYTSRVSFWSCQRNPLSLHRPGRIPSLDWPGF